MEANYCMFCGNELDEHDKLDGCCNGCPKD